MTSFRSRSQCKPSLSLVLFLRLSATFWFCRSRKQAAGCRDRGDQFPKQHDNQVNNLDTTRAMRGASPSTRSCPASPTWVLGCDASIVLAKPDPTITTCRSSGHPCFLHADDSFNHRPHVLPRPQSHQKNQHLPSIALSGWLR
ncbi:hypothetical protein B0T25DRAFT_33820 [Lasiosphaeria hispida]|uniref:Secreted protein n=1 Tax=Lasiosphaeria hispida TaxID=260671 RepID=A0AAJ0HUW8_9PEZI|nr:hypothetical protein B0T25DRAFT_33820 [Lasiosphaeria hispida]